MWEYNYNYSNELYHYGVKGMKWGVRRYQNSDGSLNAAGRARQSYKDSKKELKTARKELRKSGGFGMNAIRKYETAEKKYNDASMKTLDAKAQYKAAKSKNAEKAEFKTYVKEMGKGGLPGSAYDRSTGGRSKLIYDNLTAKKGEAYADKVAKKVQNKTAVALAATAVAVVGSTVVNTLLELQDY